MKKPEVLPYKNPTFRHEAGEGWHPKGLHNDVYGTILILNALYQQLPDPRYKNDPGLHNAIDIWEARCDRLKEIYKLTDPPSLPPAEE